MDQIDSTVLPVGFAQEIDSQLEADFLLIDRILDEDDNMDFEIIRIQKWILNIKKYMSYIHKKGFTPEQFFDMIRYKNELLEKPSLP